MNGCWSSSTQPIEYCDVHISSICFILTTTTGHLFLAFRIFHNTFLLKGNPSGAIAFFFLYLLSLHVCITLSVERYHPASAHLKDIGRMSDIGNKIQIKVKIVWFGAGQKKQIF